MLDLFGTTSVLKYMTLLFFLFMQVHTSTTEVVNLMVDVMALVLLYLTNLLLVKKWAIGQ